MNNVMKYQDDIAQLVEQGILNSLVAGSIPAVVSITGGSSVVEHHSYPMGVGCSNRSLRTITAGSSTGRATLRFSGLWWFNSIPADKTSDSSAGRASFLVNEGHAVRTPFRGLTLKPNTMKTTIR